jgi:hypothetical protein
MNAAGNISETERSSDIEIDFIRRFASTEAVGKKMIYELGMVSAIKQMQARGK